MQPGEPLGERYRLVEALGRGASGEVWSAIDSTGARFVIKCLRSTVEPELEKRFERELAVARQLGPPYFPRLIDGRSGPEGPRYIVWAAEQGSALADLALDADRAASSGLRRLLPVAELLRALSRLHALGIVHRDLKPEHVLVKPDGSVVLLDLGLCRVSDSLRLTASRHILGSAAFVAPEQIQAPQNVDQRADLYAVGAIAFWLLSGRLPFAAPTAESLLVLKLMRQAPLLNDVCEVPVPAAVEEWVAMMLAREPTGRPASASAAGEKLEHALGGD